MFVLSKNEINPCPQYRDVNIVNVFSEAIIQWEDIIEAADKIQFGNYSYSRINICDFCLRKRMKRAHLRHVLQWEDVNIVCCCSSLTISIQ